ncbi:MAG: recombinase family protein [Ktedonobacterales bacterium]|nr:recombinase family protein [Ktedonobacterales bacterium]
MSRRPTPLGESFGASSPRTIQRIVHLTTTPLSYATPASSLSVLYQADLVRAALYARVSTEKQERDETLGSQLAALHQASVERGYQVGEADVFRDEGYSGAHLDRPALDRLRDLVAEGIYDVVLGLTSTTVY